MDIQKTFIRPKTWLAFWIWRNLAGGRLNFYNNPTLWRHKTFVEPITGSRLRRWLWNRAVSYLVRNGQLTETTALREKF